MSRGAIRFDKYFKELFRVEKGLEKSKGEGGEELGVVAVFVDEVSTWIRVIIAEGIGGWIDLELYGFYLRSFGFGLLFLLVKVFFFFLIGVFYLV